jgi:GAF domain-containing protein
MIANADLFRTLGDPDRMAHIAEYDLFHPEMRTRMDAIATRTATLLGAPVSLISVILDSSQFILGSHGVTGWMAEAQGIPAEWSLCASTMLSGRPYCVADGAADPVVATNPLRLQTDLRSYAGVPLSDGGNHTLGAHCILDVVPRTFSDHDIAVLTDGAHAAAHVLTDYRTP